MRRELLALAEPGHRRVMEAARRLGVAVLALALVCACLLGRLGSYRARFAACVLLGGYVLVALLLAGESRRALGSPRGVVRRLFGSVDAPEARRLLDAAALVDARDDGSSQALRELHFARVLARVDVAGLRAVAGRRADTLRRATWVVGLLALGACGSRPWSVLEGADVLLARDGVAPLELVYLADLAVTMRPPDYLKLEERPGRLASDEAAPLGSLLSFRGTPVHDGRALYLSDGQAEIPFVDDGSGQLVARYPLEEDAELRVIARFGEVRIEEPRVFRVHVIADLPPVVELENAPSTVHLSSDELGEVVIRYEATDDHGLREVHLVLRSGTREERRSLARLDGATRSDKGGYVLRTKDAFVAGSYAPVEVTVEAKDNDPIRGPKWGKSAAITLIPPEIGEAEVLRLQALRALRDAAVDALAASLTPFEKGGGKESRQARELQDRVALVEAKLMELTLGRYANLRFPSRLGQLLVAQLAKVRAAQKVYLAAPTEKNRQLAHVALERMVLVVDATGAGRSVRDARAVAQKLSSIADELSLALRLADDPKDHETAEVRRRVARTVLAGGGKWLSALGSLGRDLGEITVAYGKRIDRASADEDWFHATLAAIDLSARLSEPDPSFQSEGVGGGGGAGGGEAGGLGSTPSEQGAGGGSDAERAFQEAAAELAGLVEKHGEKLAETERDAEGQLDPEDVQALREQMAKHAEAVRSIAKDLPSVGGGSDSWSGKGAEARDNAEQMAHALEAGNAQDAVGSGSAAKNALREAKQRLREAADPAAAGTIADAERRLEEELRYAEKLVDELRAKARERGKAQLKRHGEDEGALSDHMRALGQKAGDKDSLPEEAREALAEAERRSRAAAEALKRGEGERGVAEQRSAQRSLERAREAMGNDDGEGEGDEGDGDMSDGAHAEIPKADAHKGPEAFRQRVMRGLGQASGKNRDAVQRYAEGLVR